MTLGKLVVLVSLAVFLQGCWFIYIPGSAMRAIGDTFTGAEGSNCVREGTKVGDTVRDAGGRASTVKSLSGTSQYCKNPMLPIRALLVLSDNSALQPTAAARPEYNSAISLSLPAGWVKIPLTEQMNRDGALLYAQNPTFDARFVLTGYKRENITDLEAFAYTKRSLVASNFSDRRQSEVFETTVNGKPARRFEVTGTTPDSHYKITYTVCIIEGATEIAFISVWALASNFSYQKGALESLAENIVGL